MEPTAKSFILDLLSTIRRGTMPVGALVEAAGLFGIPENTLRVALARLRATGRVARDRRGRYRLGPRAESVAVRLASWRHPERALRAWDGGWIGVHPAGGAPRRAARRRGRALKLLGFRALSSALYLRPDNLRMSVAEIRDQLRRLGLPPDDLVFDLRDLDPQADARARDLWDTATIRMGHRRLRLALERSARRMPSLSVTKAMTTSFLLGGAAIRRLVLDPLLPEEICAPADREALAAAMRRYDELGRSAWAEFLARFDVPHHRNPVHSRAIDQAAAVA